METDRMGILSSAESMKTSLEAVRDGHAGLSGRRKSWLKRVPESGDWITLGRESVTTKDIAFLSAATHHEFALLRGRKEDILFHGTERHCEFTGELFQLLKDGKLTLVAHTHPDREKIIPSAADRKFLKSIGQEKSIIVSYITGKEREFRSNMFEELL